MKKNVIVTGGSRGIGRAIAETLLRDGFSVHILGRDEKNLHITATDLGGLGKVHVHALDLGNREAIEQFTEAWQEPLYALVNNAGICETLPLKDETENDPWDRILSTNLTGPYLLTKGLLKKIENSGRIINISSQLGMVGREDYSAYCASKFGLNGLTSVWAKELGSRGILVNAVLPGWVATEMSIKDVERMAKEGGVSYEEKYQELSEPLELKRFTKPSEVAEVVAFLVSEKGSGVTGRTWLVNGPCS